MQFAEEANGLDPLVKRRSATRFVFWAMNPWAEGPRLQALRRYAAPTCPVENLMDRAADEFGVEGAGENEGRAAADLATAGEGHRDILRGGAGYEAVR